jgi:hypothetical protein
MTEIGEWPLRVIMCGVADTSLLVLDTIIPIYVYHLLLGDVLRHHFRAESFPRHDLVDPARRTRFASFCDRSVHLLS